MRTLLIFILLLTMTTWGWAARKALVIGNADYSSSPLRNPINDAQLIASTLRGLDFQVTLITDADLQRMDMALNTFITDLRLEDEAVFYYSGHGANFNGENYLIPIGRDIQEDTELKYHAFSSNLALERMQRARTTVMILDACRDNPFRGARSGSKGLAIMQGKAGSQYIIYSTEQGKTAADGSGANSPFTESFAKHIQSPERIEDVMKKVTLEVKTKTYDNQIPWTAGNLIEDFYFAKAAPIAPQQVKPEVTVTTQYATGSISVESSIEGEIWLDGVFQKTISPDEIVTLSNVALGSHKVELKYNGSIDVRDVTVNKAKPSIVIFEAPMTPSNMIVIPDVTVTQTNPSGVILEAPMTPSNMIVVPDVAVDIATPSDVVIEDPITPSNMIYVPGGTFLMGRTKGSGDGSELPTHSVTLNAFYMGIYEVTQSEYTQYMQPSSNWTIDDGLGEKYPAYSVSWYSILKYCNLRSMAEGLTPVYRILGSTNPAKWGSVPTSNDTTWNAAVCNWNANGYRLPTEAEWEYAARGATNTPDYHYSGSDDINAVAWYAGNNDPDGSKPVGTKAPNGLGLHDMSGNLWEWCWDLYNISQYSSSPSPSSNPTGPESGSSRLLRGGGWSGSAALCRVSYRSFHNPYHDFFNLGFRLCRANID